MNLFCILADDFVQPRPGAAGLSQDTPEPLLGLAGRALPSDHNGNLCFGHVHTLIQDPVRHKDGKDTFGEILQDGEPLAFSCM